MHLAATYDSRRCRLCRDGVEIASKEARQGEIEVSEN